MSLTKIFAVLATTSVLTATAVMADPPHDRHPPAMGMSMHGPANDRSWRDDRGTVHNDHDRYWRQGYRGYVTDHNVFFKALRSHGYSRWDGSPYWYQGRYVVRSYDRSGRAVFVELNPYTGGYIGVVRF